MYRTMSVLFAGLMLCTLSITASADEPTTLIPELQVFKPILGKTFRGEFANSTPEKPVVDISRWERAMNGQAIRMMHSINDGIYGGETIIMWDKEKKKLLYWYFTTGGFRTEGTMDVEDGKWITVEKVTGAAEGVTEVKATTELTADGKLIVKSQHLKNGEWQKGRETTYVESPNSTVKFK